MTHKIRLASLVGLGLVTFLLMPSRVFANGIQVSPAIKEISLVESQEQISFEFTVRNDTQEDAVLKLSALDFGSLDESGGVAFVSRSSDGLSTTYGLSQWMRFSKDSVVLTPGESENIQAYIDNKESLAPGGHYGAIVITPFDTELQEDENTVAVNPALSVLVLLKKSGGAQYGLRLDSLEHDGGLFSLGSQLAMRFQNTGNIHVVPRGVAKLISPSGEEIARRALNEDSVFILPETFRKINTSLNFDTKPRLPGKYKIEVEWRYDEQQNFEKSVVEFYYLGTIFHLLLFAGCSVLICYVVIKAIKHRKVFHSRGKTHV